MAKFTQNTKLKGQLDFEVSVEKLFTAEGKEVEVVVLHESTITEVTKEDEKVYDLTSVLEDYNGRTIALSISEEKELDPIGE